MKQPRPAQPAWLKSMANGALGEARARAILLERFDVHTRSVDTHGADFLIELKGAGRFSQTLAPRLGIVQAKFAQDGATSHEIAAEYLVDEGRSIDEFFVIVTVGREDAVTHHLLSASDVATLPRQHRGGREVHLLSGKDRKRFKAASVTDLLDRIEDSLVARTEQQNERFLRSINIPDFEVKRGDLDPSWILPVPNEHGYVPDLVFQLRNSLRGTLYSFDDIVGPIQALLKSRDADACAKAIADLLAAYGVEHDEITARIEINLRDLPKLLQRLENAVEVHGRRFQRLVDEDRLDAFIEVASSIQTVHEAFVVDHMEPEKVSLSANSWKLAAHHAMTCVRLNPETLSVEDVNTHLVSAGTALPLTACCLAASRELWRYANEGGASTWRELDRLNHLLMAQYYGLLFPDELIGKPSLPVYMAE